VRVLCVFSIFYLSLDASKQFLWSARSRVCPQDINSDPAWSENLYTQILNKPPPGEPFTASTLQHLPLQHLLFGDFTIAIFSFLQHCVSSSLGCINWPGTSLWVPFYRIILGFNLWVHRWGFVLFFIHPLLILARSTSFRTNSCGFSYYLYHPLDLDQIGF
jgi:hypothetical protein